MYKALALGELKYVLGNHRMVPLLFIGKVGILGMYNEDVPKYVGVNPWRKLKRTIV